MEYSEALEKIHSLDKFGSKPGLDRVSMLFSLIGEDLLNQNFIHVAGTNGKGSVCQMISSILIEEGYEVGLFISPFIINFNERIQINGKEISNEELAENTEYLWKYVEQLNKNDIIITEFEFVNALAFYTYKKHNCDYIVCEVGMGGLLDSTNLIRNPICSVITKVDFDHTAILGDTLEEIAKQKCGIIKKGSITVTSSQQKDVLNIIRETAKQNDNLLFYSSDIKLDDINYSIDYTSFIYKDTPMRMHLLGKHQIDNLKTALTVIDVIKFKNIKVSIESDKLGLEKVKNPARFECISKEPLIILDGAHNPSGLNSFSDSVKLYQSENKKVLILGMLKDKDIDNSLTYIDGLFDKIITTRVSNPRTEDENILKDKCQSICSDVISESNPLKALEIAKQSKYDIYIAGSLYLASELRQHLIKEK